jgi:hypothetical protein
MKQPLYPSRRVVTVTVTNGRKVKVWLCPVCLVPRARKLNLADHMARQHGIDQAAFAANHHDLVSIPAEKTTTLRFAAPRRRHAAADTPEDPPLAAAGAGHE